MTLGISDHYRELLPEEIRQAAEDCAAAWMDPEIPARQYRRAVESEIEGFRRGVKCAPFDALVKVLRAQSLLSGALLDVGASGGYYREILRVAGFNFNYTGIDLSPTFKALAETLYPDIAFIVGDARRLPYEDDAFDIVLNGAQLMHCFEYKTVIQEAARVSRAYAVFHRVPLWNGDHTIAFIKDGYGVPMFEWRFNEAELLARFEECGLALLHSETVFWNHDSGHRTYLLLK